MRHLLIGLLLVAAAGASAQQFKVTNLEVQARGDYQREYVGGETDRDASGFKGKYFNVFFTADLPFNLSFAVRHRLNKTTFDSNFFDATDFLNLSYRPLPQLSVSAGKLVHMVGGFEYDRAPISLYYCSDYWNHTQPYVWGVSATFSPNEGRDELSFQFAQSPFYHLAHDTYSYNLYWRGQHGVWSTIWSINAVECGQGKFVGYLALGNRFDFGKVRLDFDFMNRSAKGGAFLFGNYTVVGEIAYEPVERLWLTAKTSYDVNHTHGNADQTVWAGTELWRHSASIEYYPLRDKSLRLHAAYAYGHGTSTHPTPDLQDRQHCMDIGATYVLDITRFFKKKQ